MPQAAYVISDTDRRGLVVVVATLFMSWMVLVSLFRIYMRLAIIGPWGLDDLMAIFGAVSTEPCARYLGNATDLKYTEI